MDENKVKLLLEAVELNRTIAACKLRLMEIDAHFESDGVRVLSDKKINQTTIYADSGESVSVTLASKLDIIDAVALKGFIPEGIYASQMSEKESEVTYTPKPLFKRFLIAVAKEEYDQIRTVESLLKETNPELDSKNLDFLCKKLKGTYDNDFKWLSSVTGKSDLDVELYHINLVKNWELICTIWGSEPSDLDLEDLRHCIMVDESLKIEYNYPGKK